MFVEFGENEDGHHERDVERKGDKNHHTFLFADRPAYDGLIVACISVATFPVTAFLIRVSLAQL